METKVVWSGHQWGWRVAKALNSPPPPPPIKTTFDTTNKWARDFLRTCFAAGNIFANHDVHSSLWQIIRSTLQQAAINNNTMDDFLNDELKRGKRSGIEITHTIGKQCRLARIAIRLPTSRRRPHDRWDLIQQLSLIYIIIIIIIRWLIIFPSHSHKGV